MAEWTPADMYDLIGLVNEGASMDRMCLELGRGRKSISERMESFGMKMQLQETQYRKCMKCQKKFPSEGSHNRLCYGCKATWERHRAQFGPEVT